MRTETADVVILGGGAAGLSAALAAAEAGAQVAVVSKVYPMRSHTVAAEGGAAGVHRAADSVELHAADTLRSGAGLAEAAAVNYVVAQAPVELARLERMGMPFSRTDDGDVATRPFGGMSQPRTWFAADKTGFHLLHTLFQTALQFPNIKFFNEYFALDLFLSSPVMSGVAPSFCDGTQEDITASSYCGYSPGEGNAESPPQVGLLTYSQANGEPVLFISSALVIATGGYSRAWGTSTNAAIVTGDGQALALRAELPLRDMEFVQWHPTCLPGTGFLITEAARGEGGVLLDKNGKRYLADYGLGPETPLGQPEPRRMELGPRDALSQAFVAAVADGRTRKLAYAAPNLHSLAAAQSADPMPQATNSQLIDVVDLDLTHLGSSVLKEKLPLVVEFARRYARVDATKQPIPICPAAHYTMGGIVTDVAAQVLDAAGAPVAGLFAAGECASTGLHGANRLGSNSLVETLVMGRTAGANAAASGARTSAATLSPRQRSFCAKSEAMKTQNLENTHKLVGDSALPSGPQNDEGNQSLQVKAEQAWAKWAGLRGQGTENHYQLQAELGAALDQNFGIRLTEPGLAELAERIESLTQRYQDVRVDDTVEKYNTDWQQAIELGYLLDCARATVAAAQARQESRGAFQIREHPEPEADPHHSLVTWDSGQLKVTRQQVGDSALPVGPQNDGESQHIEDPAAVQKRARAVAEVGE